MRALAVTAVIAAIGAGATGLILAACSSESFTTPDGGDDATGDRTPPADGGDGGLVDGPVDAAPLTWCAKNAPDATACADFDRIDAASSLVPFWLYTALGNGAMTVTAGPGGASDASAPSSPNQLRAAIAPLDSGTVNFAVLRAVGPVNASEATLSFDFFVEPASYGSTEVVYAANVQINAANSPLGLVLAQEGPAWQIRRFAPSFGLDSITISPSTWHRISLTLRKSPGTYLVSLDGSQILAGSVTWPGNVIEVAGYVAVEEAVATTTQRLRWFDNVVFDAK
jgi:hypothetical protein